MVKILVVEDDVNLLQVICNYLRGQGYEPVAAADGREALLRLADGHFEMVITDIMMPRMDGYELAKAIRAADVKMPIVFITAREDLQSKKKGYDVGIDEYLVKPFSLDELAMRIRAILRRADSAAAHLLTMGNLTLNTDEHVAYVDGVDIKLTLREFQILYKLLSFPRKPFTRAQLMEDFWGYDTSTSSRTVDVYMTKIREKTHACDGFDIVTVHGLGYKAVPR